MASSQNPIHFSSGQVFGIRPLGKGMSLSNDTGGGRRMYLSHQKHEHLMLIARLHSSLHNCITQCADTVTGAVNLARSTF